MLDRLLALKFGCKLLRLARSAQLEMGLKNGQFHMSTTMFYRASDKALIAVLETLVLTSFKLCGPRFIRFCSTGHASACITCPVQVEDLVKRQGFGYPG